MRPWALGRKNWLFAGSLKSGERAAVIMSLIQSARLNGLDPYAYLADVLKRLPTPHCQNSCHPHLNNPNGEKGDNHGTIQCRTQTSYTEQTFIT